jgi:WD40-like Beta Propeller Repeat
MFHSNNLKNHTRLRVGLMLSPLVLMAVVIVAPAPRAFTAIKPAVNVPPPEIWSAPVNLGAVINSTAADQQPAISPDGLSLYFTSNRVAGSLGGFDMYVSQRASVDGAWGPPINLGPALNTTFDEGNAAFSRDGRLLFFQSKRTPNNFGGIDIWVAHRNNPHDDFDWQPAVNVGPGVNSAFDDNGLCYFEDEVRGTRQLYFGSVRPGLGGTDIYVSEQMPDGSFAPATLVTELSSVSNETDPSIRPDGLEIFFHSNRTGSIGTAFDLWVATRASTADAWSIPVSVGSPINTASIENNPYLSFDGMTLFFTSDRLGGFGGVDLYVSARTLPMVRSKNITVAADDSCVASISPSDVDDGSFDSVNGGSLTLSLDPAAAGPFGLGEHTVRLIATDDRGQTNSAIAIVTVVDQTPPVISNASVDKPTLWSPNHQMIDVTVNYTTTDNCGGSEAGLDVSSNEAINGTGDGDTAPDWEIVDAHHVRLRAERSGHGSGRIYTITITATDSHGNSSNQALTVGVPHS